MDHKTRVALGTQVQTNVAVVADMSSRQREKLVYLAVRYEPSKIVVRFDFSLPEDYIAVEIYKSNDCILNGGISPEGEMST